MEELRRSPSPSHGLATMADQELQRVLEALQQRERDVDKLRTQLKEVLHINHQWDAEYRELQQKFDQYQQDTKQAQSDSQAFIAKLTNEKEQMAEDMRLLDLGKGDRREQDLLDELESVKCELHRVKESKERLEKKLIDARVKYDCMKKRYDEAMQLKVSLTDQLQELKQQQGSSSTVAKDSTRIAQLKEEVLFLHQQLKVYQEDFEAERRDRQRLSREKETSQLHYEAEITSLKLQLDRCRAELTRFQMEANRLGQQLRLRRQAEQEQFRKHLESKGYAPRYPNQPLPPLDPYVENDVPVGYHPSQSIVQHGSRAHYVYQTSRPAPPSRGESSPQFRRMGPVLLQSRDSMDVPSTTAAAPPSQIVAEDHNYTVAKPPSPTHEILAGAQVTPINSQQQTFQYSCPKCHNHCVCGNQ